VGVGEDRRRVAVLDPVVGRLHPARVAGQPAALAQRDELVLPPGDDLVDVGLVARVPQHDVVGRVEHPVDGKCQLDHAQVRTEVTTRDRHCVHDELPDLRGQLVELLVREAPQISRRGDRLQKSHWHPTLPPGWRTTPRGFGEPDGEPTSPGLRRTQLYGRVPHPF
jgi:hypothetical protein